MGVGVGNGQYTGRHGMRFSDRARDDGCFLVPPDEVLGGICRVGERRYSGSENLVRLVFQRCHNTTIPDLYADETSPLHTWGVQFEDKQTC